jgi:hypothetical protein
MPLETGIIAPAGVGLEGLRRIAEGLNPPLTVTTEFDESMVVFRDRDARVVAALQRPQQATYGGDLRRCCDGAVPEAGTPAGAVWTEGCVPMSHAQAGLEVIASVARACGGRMLVKGVPE